MIYAPSWNLSRAICQEGGNQPRCRKGLIKNTAQEWVNPSDWLF